MFVQVAEQPFDGQPADNCGGDKADCQQWHELAKIGHFEQVKSFVATCRQHDRHGHQEGEASRGRTVQAACHPAADGRPGAGGAGKTGQNLGNADEQGVQPGHFFKAAVAFAQPFGQRQHNGGDEQADGGFQQLGLEQGFHHGFEQIAEDQRRDGGDDDIPGQAC